jgi:NhaP-type Na+/H+ or K+/H+ antiporter
MNWIHWAGVILGSWLLLSLPAALLLGRLLRSRDPLAGILVIDEADRRPLPPALRAEVPSATG